jgi:hypothetical protein
VFFFLENTLKKKIWAWEDFWVLGLLRVLDWVFVFLNAMD